MIYIDEEMLSWYYSIMESNEEYAEGTGSTFSADIAQLVEYGGAVRQIFTGKPSDKQQLVLDKAWETYERIADTAVTWVTAPATYMMKRYMPQYAGAVAAGGNISRWTADGMKYVMKATGYDERIVQQHMDRHHLD